MSKEQLESFEPAEFIEKIRKAVYSGYGFVPFLGSGISADSGILMGQQFTSYLAYTVWRCVADEGLQSQERLNLRKSGWPDFDGDASGALEWIKNQFQRCKNDQDPRMQSQEKCPRSGTLEPNALHAGSEAQADRTATAIGAFRYPLVPEILCNNTHYPKGEAYNEEVVRLAKIFRLKEWISDLSGAPGESRTSKNFIERRAIHSLHHWKATLWFLAQLRLEGDRLSLGGPDMSVIDLFNTHITRGRRPNFCHTMLAHLARPLRFRVLFTTNFDCLLETAFEDISDRLTVFHVSAKGGLPDARTVRAQNTLIKLHGEMAETRADFTLDDPPPPDDLDRFFRCVTARVAGDAPGIPNHLLVVGYSGDDERCIHFLKHVLDKDENVKLYWICRSDGDVNKVSKLFKEYHPDLEGGRNKRIVTVKTERPDLLLYQIYQRVTLALPPGGFSYTYTHRAPPTPASEDESADERVNDKEENVFSWVKQSQEPLERTFVQWHRTGDGNNARGRHAAGEKIKEPFWEVSRIPTAYDLRLLPDVKSTDKIPDKGERLVIVAELTGNTSSSLYFRIFNAAGERVLDKPEAKFDAVENIKELKEKLFNFWSQESLPACEQASVIRLITSITSFPNGNLLLLDGNRIVARAREWYQWEIKNRRNCVWIELEDSETPEAALHELLATVALHRGTFQLEHVEFVSRSWGNNLPHETEVATRLGLLCKQMRARPEEWTFLLYGRTVPGSCSGWNGQYWSTSAYERWTRYLRAMAAQGFTVVYMPFSKKRQEAHSRRISQVQRTVCTRYGLSLSQDWIWEDFRAFREQVSSQATPGEDHEQPIHKVLPWLSAAAGKIEDAAFRDEFIHFQRRTSPDPPGPQHTDAHTIRPSTAGESPDQKPTFRTLVKVEDQWVWSSRENAEPAEPGQDSPPAPEDREQELLFLYGLALFRQARHPNAILTDAVFPCPERFNTNGFDNDWARHKQATTWVRKLEEDGVFHLKPGGYEWMYRDTRSAILRFIESRTNWTFYKKGEQRFIHYAGQKRARMHDSIASWYLNVFCATGHITPLRESLFHRMQALQFSLFDKDSCPNLTSMDIWIDRVLLFRASLGAMLKTLLLARPWANFWVAEPAAAHLFKEGKAHLNEVWGQFANIARDKMKAPDGNLDFHLDEIESLKEETTHEFDELNVHAEKRPHSIRNSILPSVNKHNHQMPISEFTSQIIEVGIKDEMLAKDGCIAAFKKRFADSRYIQAVLDLDMRTRELFRNWIWTHPKENLYTAVALLTEFAYLHVKLAKLQKYATTESPLNNWKAVCQACNRALRITPYLHPSSFHLEISQRVKALTFYGLALGYLGRYFEAHRRLNEARALLSKQSMAVDPLELAKIYLRRAEVCLLEAKDAEDIATAARTALASEIYELPQIPSPKRESVLREVIKASMPSRNTKYYSTADIEQHAKRLCAAKIDDAWCVLEAAESQLSGRSHSSLWWGRWIALSLRAYAAAQKMATGFRTLPFRRPVDSERQIERLFETDWLLSDDDPYRQLRLIDVYWQALPSRLKNDKKKEELMAKLPTGSKCHGKLNDYRNQVMIRLSDMSL